MTIKTHATTAMALSMIVSGVAANYIYMENPVFYDLNPKKLYIGVAHIAICIIAGAIYPDVDHDESLLSDFSFSDFEWEDKLERRGIVHTIFPNAFGVLIPFLLLNALLDNQWIIRMGLAFSVGTIWHLIGGDIFTPEGIMLFYPFTRHKFKIPIIKTYEAERIYRFIVSFSLMAYGIYCWYLYLKIVF